MDVNGSRYHLLYGEQDWLPLLVAQGSDKLWWDRVNQNISLAPEILKLPLPEGDTLLEPEHRRGAAYDHYGNVYWINPDENEILMRPAATPDTVGSFWSVKNLNEPCESEAQPGEFHPVTPDTDVPLPTLRGLTVTTHEYLVVGTLEPTGLLIFDMHAGGAPDWLQWPEAVPFSPFDIAATDDAGFWILDRKSTLNESRVWHFDRYFRIAPCNDEFIELEPEWIESFHPEEGGTSIKTARRFPAGISLQQSSPIDAMNPLSIESLPDGSIIILDSDPVENKSIVKRYKVDSLNRNLELSDSVALDQEVINSLLDVRYIDAHDFLFRKYEVNTPYPVEGELFLSAMNGEQAFQVLLRVENGETEKLKLTLRPALIPMRNYGGMALIKNESDVFYDSETRWIPLAEQPRRRFSTEKKDGIVPSLAGIIFDGKQPDTTWHRLMLDACIPEGTTVTVETRAANERDYLKDLPWFEEPAFYRRAEGSEIPYHQPFIVNEDNKSHTGTWETIFQHATGRYIEIRLTVYGTGRSSPLIQALRAYYPRFSYLKEYLPDVYRENAHSASFLDRFLANVEGFYTAIEGRIEQVERLFDTRTAPHEYLDWLAGWLGSVMDPTWSDQRRRLFLDHAELLYRWRGTQIGMRAAIRLTIDECPDESIFDELENQRDYQLGTLGGRHVRIVEDYLSRTSPGIVIGDPNAKITLGLAAQDAPWDPSQGAGPLHKRYQEKYLRVIYYSNKGDEGILENIKASWGIEYNSVEEILFPPTLPDNEAMASDWKSFVRDGIGFSYAIVTSNDELHYQDFLGRRYQRIEVLNASYGFTPETAYSSFSEISLPDELPHSGQELTDWIEFVSLSVPIKRNAHRFTVLVPTELNESYYERLRRMAQVEEIVAREKPAHTDFNVKLYWALFQIGTARLGMDTTIGEGSRFVALILGTNYLGQSYLTESHPWAAYDRMVMGRDRLEGRFSRRETQ